MTTIILILISVGIIVTGIILVRKQKQKQNTLIIDRSKWRTGENGDYSTGVGRTLLLNNEGNMCCLGFECLRIGLSKEQINGKGAPDNHDMKFIIWRTNRANHLLDKKNGIILGSNWMTEAIGINDDTTIDSVTREARIIDHFKLVGITVKFTGEYHKK